MRLFRKRADYPYDRYLSKLKAKPQTEEGQEVLSSVPLAPPVGWIKQPSMVDNLRAMVRSELLRRAAMAAGAETFDEADDFEVEDDLEPTSGYENDPDFEPAVVREAYAKAAEVEIERRAAARSSRQSEPGVEPELVQSPPVGGAIERGKEPEGRAPVAEVRSKLEK